MMGKLGALEKDLRAAILAMEIVAGNRVGRARSLGQSGCAAGRLGGGAPTCAPPAKLRGGGGPPRRPGAMKRPRARGEALGATGASAVGFLGDDPRVFLQTRPLSWS